jgi:hypothetical protein
MGLFNFLYKVILLLLLFFRPFKIIRALKLFRMMPNFKVRPRAVAHLALAQGHPCHEDSSHSNYMKSLHNGLATSITKFIKWK